MISLRLVGLVVLMRDHCNSVFAFVGLAKIVGSNNMYQQLLLIYLTVTICQIMIATICDIVHVTVSTFVADFCDTTLLRYLPLHSPKSKQFIVGLWHFYCWFFHNLFLGRWQSHRCRFHKHCHFGTLSNVTHTTMKMSGSQVNCCIFAKHNVRSSHNSCCMHSIVIATKN